MDPAETKLTEEQLKQWNLVERESIIVYQGKVILFDDYSHFHGEEAIRIIRLHGAAVLRRNRFNLLGLIDVTGSYANQEVLAVLKETAKLTARFYAKSAVIGCVGVQKYFLMLVNKFSGMGARPFDHKQDALDWLVS